MPEFEIKRGISRRRFLAMTAGAIGGALGAGCAIRSQSPNSVPAVETATPFVPQGKCSDAVMIKGETPLNVDPGRVATSASYAKDAKNPDEEGSRIIAIEPGAFRTVKTITETAKVPNTNLQLGTGMFLDTDGKTLAVRSESKKSNLEFPAVEARDIVDPDRCNVVRAFWERGAFVDIQINGKAPRNIRRGV